MFKTILYEVGAIGEIFVGNIEQFYVKILIFSYYSYATESNSVKLIAW